jgi:hypothetical protein
MIVMEQTITKHKEPNKDGYYEFFVRELINIDDFNGLMKKIGCSEVEINHLTTFLQRLNFIDIVRTGDYLALGWFAILKGHTDGFVYVQTAYINHETKDVTNIQYTIKHLGTEKLK